MGDWQELGQTVFISLIFAFLLAKLISIVISFREENLRVSREVAEPDLPEPLSTGSFEVEEPLKNSSSDSIEAENSRVLQESGVSEVPRALSEVAEHSKLHGESFLDDDDDDWEGVESTELDESFSAATSFVATMATDRSSQKVSNETQLELYGLYKIATEGPCNIPQPSALKISARAKWNAWQRLGTMPPEEAMQRYIMIVSQLYPTWASGGTSRNKEGDDGSSATAKGGTMGPVFSTFAHDEDSDSELKMEGIHVCAREGEMNNLLKYLEQGDLVNSRDSDGRSALHWAVDRGHLDIVELLIKKNADVNAKDNEGQTALHYAAVCDRELIAKLLIEHGADGSVKDNDGNTPRDVCTGRTWTWI
ncbi:acyl-CoA-binding domain-containing protein 1 isoform X1 [Amborella trichopoda]|uniref:acyl-CoA-binding domain-containing protein 1 isoform X1 n=1 Tax=Amborella trichopoda TaxID=13333 RepID=UPI0005D3FAB8|nr:acyl-CoA-binding domain-containing protein 1 isoform X1 [Amborella trichopoda]|eukprot:XP_011625425.1 acyl-CoA-binding domain-containing protein 1 isoform X1 [Amborella trichopoda]